MAGEKWRYNGRTMYLANEYYDKVDALAKKERRPKTQQLQVIIDYYLENHPDKEA